MKFRSSGFEYFHVGRKPDCTEIRPSKFDVHGRMPEAAVFVTTADHLAYWAGYIRDASEVQLYLYGVDLPESARIEEGIDGAELGDFKVITNKALPVTFIRVL